MPRVERRGISAGRTTAAVAGTVVVGILIAGLVFAMGMSQAYDP